MYTIPAKTNIEPNRERMCRFPIDCDKHPKYNFPSHSVPFQSKVKQLEFLSFQRLQPIDSWFCSTFGISERERCHPKYDNQLRRNELCCVELATSPDTRLLRQQTRARSINPKKQGTVQIQDEVPSSVCAKQMDASDYQVFNLKENEIHWEAVDLNMDTTFGRRIDTFFLLKLFPTLRRIQRLTTQFWLTARKTTDFNDHQSQSLSDSLSFPGFGEINPLDWDWCYLLCGRKINWRTFLKTYVIFLIYSFIFISFVGKFLEN